jgi:hypothetical protein
MKASTLDTGLQQDDKWKKSDKELGDCSLGSIDHRVSAMSQRVLGREEA